MPVATGSEASTGCTKGAVALRNRGGIVSRTEERPRSYLAFVQTGLQFYGLKELRSVSCNMAHGLHSVEKNIGRIQEGNGARFCAGDPVCDVLTEEFVVAGGTHRFG
jgi:hypothetical protein